MPGAASGPVRTTIWPARSPTAAPRPPLGATPRCARRMRSRSALRAAPDSGRYGPPAALRTWRGPPSRWSTPARHPRLATQSSAASGHPGLANALHQFRSHAASSLASGCRAGHPRSSQPAPARLVVSEIQVCVIDFRRAVGLGGQPTSGRRPAFSWWHWSRVMGSRARRLSYGVQRPRTAGRGRRVRTACASASSSCPRGRRGTASRVGPGPTRHAAAPRRAACHIWRAGLIAVVPLQPVRVVRKGTPSREGSTPATAARSAGLWCPAAARVGAGT